MNFNLRMPMSMIRTRPNLRTLVSMLKIYLKLGTPVTMVRTCPNLRTIVRIIRIHPNLRFTEGIHKSYLRLKTLVNTDSSTTQGIALTRQTGCKETLNPIE